MYESLAFSSAQAHGLHGYGEIQHGTMGTVQVDALAVISRLGLARGFLLRRLCGLAFEMLGGVAAGPRNRTVVPIYNHCYIHMVFYGLVKLIHDFNIGVIDLYACVKKGIDECK